MAIALRYVEAELQPQPKPVKVVGLTSVLFFAAAVFALTLALLTLI